MTDKQIQKAGDNSSQFQAQNQSIIVNDGIPEERVDAIVNEECEKVAKTCILESQLVVEQRLGQFRTELFGAVADRAQLLTALQEPSCVDALGKAARAATMTDEKRDKELLSELLSSDSHRQGTVVWQPASARRLTLLNTSPMKN